MATEENESGFGPEEEDTTALESIDGASADSPEPVRDAGTSVAGDGGHAPDDAPVEGDAPDGRTAAAGDAPSGDAAGYAPGAIRRIVEAALLVAGRPLSMNDFEKLFGGGNEAPPRNAIRGALAELASEWSGRSLALQEVASGWRAQVRTEFEPWIARLWDEKPPRYSRALLETLAIIAYRQPMTRSEIEDIRGVSVSSQIIRTLTERGWIRVVGHREAPGRPAMYGTTREFLDYFNLKTLDQLPPISDIKDLEGQYPELGFEAEPAGNGDRSAATASDGPADTNAPAGDGPDDRDETSGPEVDEVPAAVDEDPGLPPGDDPGHNPGDKPGEDADDAEESPCTPAS